MSNEEVVKMFDEAWNGTLVYKFHKDIIFHLYEHCMRDLVELL